MGGWQESTEQEEKLEDLYDELGKKFRAFEREQDAKQQEAIMLDVTQKLQQAKGLIKEFEREARLDGMAPQAVAERKKAMVGELNKYIMIKKTSQQALSAKRELLQGGTGATGPSDGGMKAFFDLTDTQAIKDASNQQLIAGGRHQMTDIEKRLGRMERVVEDTKQVGVKTVEGIEDQNRKLEAALDDLEEIHFTLKKAKQLLRDIMRGIYTDKCIMAVFCLIVVGVVVAIALRVAGVADDSQVRIPGYEDQQATEAPAAATDPPATDAPATTVAAGTATTTGRLAMYL
ncbi:unnamed protein product [Pedinophyceae sp. YPF-701]|nr:unnamed protein product [Pedinophyceae sp. YPF-701]